MEKLYLIVFQKKGDGATTYGGNAVFRTREEAEKYLSGLSDSDTDFSIAETD